MADRLGLVALMDRHLPLSRRPLSIGTTLLLAAINRAVWPCSKRGWAAWAQRTALPHLFTLRPAALTSPYCWDQMDAVLASALEAIEAALTRKVIQELHLTLATLFYDTPNFFPSIASGNARSPRAQRGHSKPKRTDLRQCSLALLVARDGQMPLDAHVYEGHVVDAQQCPDSLPAIRQRVERIVGHIEALPLVYDKGNNAKPPQALVDAGPGHYVASLVPKHSPDLMAIPTRM
jgi:transposase